MKGQETYLKQSATAVLIGLVATLAVGWGHASVAKQTLYASKPSAALRVRTVSSQALKGLSAEETTTHARVTQDSVRACFALNTEYFLARLPAGFQLGKCIISESGRCAN